MIMRRATTLIVAATALLAACELDNQYSDNLLVDNRTSVDLEIVTATRPGQPSVSGVPERTVGRIPARTRTHTQANACMDVDLEARDPDGRVVATLPAQPPDECDPDDMWTIGSQP